MVLATYEDWSAVAPLADVKVVVPIGRLVFALAVRLFSGLSRRCGAADHGER